MRKVIILTSGRGDLHLLNWLREELTSQFNTSLTSYLPSFDTDITIVLGDRYETYCMAGEAIRRKHILCHIHGGEISNGSMDNMFRNAITKLSHYHFTATEASRDRVIAMGEDPARVMNVGALGVERVKSLRKYPKKKNQILVTWHPNTVSDKTDEETDIVLSTLSELDCGIVFCMPNLDPEHEFIRDKIIVFCTGDPHWVYYEDIGDNYIEEMEQSLAVVGNSSSGIIEAPSCGTITINIGDRQSGRECGIGIIDVPVDRDEIISSIKYFTENNISINQNNPYDKPGTRKAISDFLLDCDLTFAKTFYG